MAYFVESVLRIETAAKAGGFPVCSNVDNISVVLLCTQYSDETPNKGYSSFFR